VHVVDVSGASGRDPAADLDVVRLELRLFRPELAEKPQVVAANKVDVLSDPADLHRLAAHAADLGLPFFAISAASGAGISDLLEAVWRLLEAAHEPPSLMVSTTAPVSPRR
jgi:GTP-binding protein